MPIADVGVAVPAVPERFPFAPVGVREAVFGGWSACVGVPCGCPLLAGVGVGVDVGVGLVFGVGVGVGFVFGVGVGVGFGLFVGVGVSVSGKVTVSEGSEFTAEKARLAGWLASRPISVKSSSVLQSATTVTGPHAARAASPGRFPRPDWPLSIESCGKS